jgi:glutamate-ammonia-ligase adenylyltransferase
VAAAVAAGDFDGALRAARVEGEGEDAMAALRRERTGYSLTLAIGELAGDFRLERVFSELSDLADRSIERAITTAIAERTPGETSRGFAAVALGKLGGRELNYSSDVDLIFLFDPATMPRRAREEPAQAAVRIGQRVVELLQKRTEDGFAFRVDLRLRPAPEVTPIVLTANAAISHYESSAMPWERAAFIRARHAAGDAEVSRYFLEAIHPFVWRRSLDFGAAQEIQAVSGQIRDHYATGQLFGPGFDLKRGRGGIREIEFFAQIHQLIHGGREPALRAAATLDALPALTAAGRIAAEEGEALADAYRLLRTIEHRLQMVDDRQTHQLPFDAAELDSVAQLHGLPDGAALLGELSPHVHRVAAIYDGLAPQSAPQLPHEQAALRERLASLGFASADAAAARITGWRSGKPRALRTGACAPRVRGDAARSRRGARPCARPQCRAQPLRPDRRAAPERG